MNMKTLLLVLASLFVASAAWAVPSQLAHQGRLLDTEGVALAGEHALTFALFDAETEGNEVWSETITVNIVGGFYSVVLGADEETNPLDDLVLSNPPLWLELTVDDGAPLLPRHELLSVPYAVLAGTATNVEGGYVDASEIAVDGTTVIDASGNWVGPTPAVDWSDLSGVPAGLGDGVDADTLGGLSCSDGGVATFDLGTGLWGCGTDAVLGSSDVLGFVDGAVLDLGIGSTVNGVTIATTADLDWSMLSSVPLGFLDGDDADSLAALSCADGGVAKFNLGTGLWGCGTDSVLGSGEVLGFVNGATVDVGAGSSMGGSALATVSDLTWGSMGGIPTGFADGFDADTLAALGLTCADGDRPGWDVGLSDWVCAPEGVALDRLDTSAAASGQVMTFNGSSVEWEDPATTTNPPCTLSVLDETLSIAAVVCGPTPVALRTWMHFAQVSLGYSHSCGIDSGGSVRCWGQDTWGQSTPPTGTFTQVSTGSLHNCGISSSGTVQCWGYDVYGQSTPPAGTFTQVSAGGNHTCGINSAGAVQCWGSDAQVQSTPPAGTFTQVSAGGNHTCGINISGSVQCWGYDAQGQATPPAGTFTQVSAGGLHTCGIDSSGSIQCWGANTYNQSTPPQGTFTQVSAGSNSDHNCGIDSSGSVQCWGQAAAGQLRAPAGTFTQVSANFQHTCAVLSGLEVVTCWGADEYGQSSPP